MGRAVEVGVELGLLVRVSSMVRVMVGIKKFFQVMMMNSNCLLCMCRSRVCNQCHNRQLCFHTSHIENNKNQILTQNR
jgi:hypothetical protein